MKHSFVQSMAWLHTWAGLVVGWLLFVIFVGGTLACFDKELDDWMRPALHGNRAPQRPGFDAAIERLRQQAPAAVALYLVAANARERAMEAYVYSTDGRYARQALNPRTGARVPDTAGGEFFFTLHYNLYAGTVGMYIVALAGMLLLVALVSGVLIHRRIFKDFFTFRPMAGGQRAWLDGHNVAGVLGLPFHLVMAYTGVAIFVANYMFAGVNAAYGGDVARFNTQAADLYTRPAVGKPLPRLYPVDRLIADAQSRLGVPVAWASLNRLDDASATVVLGGDNSRRVAWNAQQVTYDAATGRFLHQTQPTAAGYATYRFLGGLHMAQFGGSALRWLYFLIGLAGCVMIASGMQVWVNKRARRIAAASTSFGYGLVLGLNVGVVAGMPLACVALLLANRLLPATLAQRSQAEITVFFAVWLAAAAWGIAHSRSGRAWRDLFATTAVALFALPWVNLATAPQSHLLATLPRGDWGLAAVDLGALALAGVFAWLARRAGSRRELALAVPARWQEA